MTGIIIFKICNDDANQFIVYSKYTRNQNLLLAIITNNKCQQKRMKTI